jgi:hypothetical protein
MGMSLIIFITPLLLRLMADGTGNRILIDKILAALITAVCQVALDDMNFVGIHIVARIDSTIHPVKALRLIDGNFVVVVWG